MYEKRKLRKDDSVFLLESNAQKVVAITNHSIVKASLMYTFSYFVDASRQGNQNRKTFLYFILSLIIKVVLKTFD